MPRTPKSGAFAHLQDIAAFKRERLRKRMPRYPFNRSENSLFRCLSNDAAAWDPQNDEVDG